MNPLAKVHPTITIVERPFVRHDGAEFSQTAVLSTEATSQSVELGVPAPETLFAWIKSGNPLNLDRCYIDGFSLDAYREWAELPTNEAVSLHNFTARHAVFASSATITFSHAVFTGDTVSFEQARFRSPLTEFLQCQFPDAPIDFQGVDFEHGDLLFHFTRFGNGSLNFDQANFGAGKTSFVNVDFGDGRKVFRQAQFGRGSVDFHFSKFGKGDKLFDKTVFRSSTIDFRKVEFGNGKLDFRWADFGEASVNFDESEVKKGKITFNRSVLPNGSFSWEDGVAADSDFTWERGNLGQSTVSFAGSTFKRIALTSCQFNNHLDLRVREAKTIDLTDTLNRDLIDLKPVKHPVQVGTLNLIGMRNLGRIILDWKANEVERMILEQPDSTSDEKADQLRILKEDFRSSGQYQDEDWAYVSFKRIELKAYLEEQLKTRNALGKFFALFRWGFEWLVFDQIGRYATNPVRVLGSMTIVYVLFSLLYVVLIPFTDADIVSSLGDPDHLSLVSKSFYHSAITFLTIGYGDYYPSGSIRWISGLEGFVGLFLLSYFTVAFVRKILR